MATPPCADQNVSHIPAMQAGQSKSKDGAREQLPVGDPPAVPGPSSAHAQRSHRAVLENVKIVEGELIRRPPKRAHFTYNQKMYTEKSEMLDFESEIHATVVHFHKVLDNRGYHAVVGRPFISSLLNLGPEVYMENLKYMEGGAEIGSKSPDLRWIHLPANNMSWVERLMELLYQSHDPDGAQVLLRPEHWVKRQFERPDSQSSAQNRFMRPFYSRVSSSTSSTRESRGIFSSKVSQKSSILYIPYIHWEEKCRYILRNKCLEWMRRNGNILEPVDHQPTRLKLSNFKETSADATATCWTRKDINWASVKKFPSDAKMLLAYANEQSPLHVRRTLDQSFYYTLPDQKIEERDLDQVLSRHCAEVLQMKGTARLLMVDQLWLWLIDEEGLTKTIVTAFPKRWSGPIDITFGGENNQTERSDGTGERDQQEPGNRAERGPVKNPPKHSAKHSSQDPVKNPPPDPVKNPPQVPVENPPKRSTEDTSQVLAENSPKDSAENLSQDAAEISSHDTTDNSPKESPTLSSRPTSAQGYSQYRESIGLLDDSILVDPSDILARILKAIGSTETELNSETELICLILDKVSGLFHPEPYEVDHALDYLEVFAVAIARLADEQTKLANQMARHSERLSVLQSRRDYLSTASFQERRHHKAKQKPDDQTGNSQISSTHLNKETWGKMSKEDRDKEVTKWFDVNQCPEKKSDNEMTDLQPALQRGKLLELERLMEIEMNALMNISSETKCLIEIKDILDELNSISNVFRQQIEILQAIVHDHHILQQSHTHKSKMEEVVNQQRTAQQAENKGKGKTEEPTEDEYGYVENEEAENKGKGKTEDLPKDEHGYTENKESKYQATLELFLSRKSDIKYLQKEASKVYNDIHDLLDLKQKQASVSEAYSARQQTKETAQQGWTILVFTIITIIFLPLTFISGIFSMNAREINGAVRPVWVIMSIMVPVAIVVLLFSLLLAFNGSIRWYLGGIWPQRDNKLSKKATTLPGREMKEKIPKVGAVQQPHDSASGSGTKPLSHHWLRRRRHKGDVESSPAHGE